MNHQGGKMGYDYWADVNGQQLPLGYLVSKIEGDGGVLRRENRDGEIEFTIAGQGKITLRGRGLEEGAYKLTLSPRGLFEITVERNHKLLKGILEKHEIELTRVKDGILPEVRR